MDKTIFKKTAFRKIGKRTTNEAAAPRSEIKILVLFRTLTYIHARKSPYFKGRFFKFITFSEMRKEI